MDKSYEKEYSALILARAGLERMARQNDAFVGRLSETLEPSTCLYAVGQVSYLKDGQFDDVFFREPLR